MIAKCQMSVAYPVPIMISKTSAQECRMAEDYSSSAYDSTMNIVACLDVRVFFFLLLEELYCKVKLQKRVRKELSALSQGGMGGGRGPETYEKYTGQGNKKIDMIGNLLIAAAK